MGAAGARASELAALSEGGNAAGPAADDVTGLLSKPATSSVIDGLLGEAGAVVCAKPAVQAPTLMTSCHCTAE